MSLSAEHQFLDRYRLMMDDPGWGLVGVFPTKDDPGPHFTYSVGLEWFRKHPEILVVGLPPTIAGGLINTAVNSYLLDAEPGFQFEVGKSYDEIIHGYPARFAHVGQAHLDQHITVSRVLQPGTEVRCLQLLWPDREGRFPDEPGFSSDEPLWTE